MDDYRYKRGIKPEQRFNALVERQDEGSCWNWVGSVLPNGYGYMFIGRKIIGAHRFALVLHTKRNEVGKNALHDCDNKLCCNPLHLRWGTQSENVQDAWSRNLAFSEKVKAAAVINCKKAQAAARKLLPSQVSYMRKLMNAGYRDVELSKWYCVSIKTVNNVRNNKYYKGI